MTLEERIQRIEALISEPNPLAHDIKLREKIERTIEAQKAIEKHLEKIDNDYLQTNRYIRENTESVTSNELDQMLDTKTANIRSEFISLLSFIKQQQQENITAFVASSDKALSGAQSSAEHANNRLKDFIDLIMMIGIIITLFSGVIGFFAYKTFNRAKQAKDTAENIQKKIINEFNQLEMLKDEIKHLQKLIDLKEAYKVYKERKSKSKPCGQIVKYVRTKTQQLIDGYSDLEIRWASQQDSRDRKDFLSELHSNQSYCYSLHGILEYYDKNYDKAFEYFKISSSKNTAGMTDRIYNLGCTASLLFQKTRAAHYLAIVIECYIALSDHISEARNFVADLDVKPIKAEIDNELRKLGKQNLITPDVMR